MKVFNLIFVLFFSYLYLTGQSPCFPAEGGIPAGNEPPGCVLCGNTYLGTTEGYDSTAIPNTDFPCGEVDKNQFISIIADSSGSIDVVFEITSMYCRGSLKSYEYAFFDQNLNVLTDCRPEKLENTIPGEIYYFMIDGDPERECNFWVNFSGIVVADLDSNAIRFSPEIQILNNRSSICLDSEICYYSKFEHGVTGFVWITPPYSKVLRGGDKKDTFVCITFWNTGIYTLGVNSIFDCHYSGFNFRPIEVGIARDSIYQTICLGDSISIGTQKFNSSGQYEIVLDNGAVGGCDSVIFLDLKTANPSAIGIQCYQDSFLNVISLKWDKRGLASKYEIYLNDSLVSVQDHVGYIYHPNFPGEEIDIKIQPIGSHGCDYAPGYLTCTAPNLTNSKEVFKKELVSVFPNPSSGVFEVFFRENSYGAKQKIERIEVFDFSGKEVKVVLNSEIDLSEFESGVYFLKIYFEEKVVLKKVIKM